MTTFQITVSLTVPEIDALLQAVRHYAAIVYEKRRSAGNRREDAMDDAADACGVIVALEYARGWDDVPPLVLREEELVILEHAIKDYGPVCAQEGDTECLACERPYSELPSVLAAILPRLDYGPHWQQTSGHIPGDPATGKPSTIWIK